MRPSANTDCLRRKMLPISTDESSSGVYSILPSAGGRVVRQQIRCVLLGVLLPPTRDEPLGIFVFQIASCCQTPGGKLLKMVRRGRRPLSSVPFARGGPFGPELHQR